jgi:hypothetical protein
MVDTTDPPQQKNFAYWPLVCVVAVPLSLVVLDATPLGPSFVYVVIGIPSLLCLWGISAIVACFVLAKSKANRSNRRALSFAILPVSVLVVAWNPFGFVRTCNYLGSAVNLAITKPSYIAEIKSLPVEGEPKLLVFNRGGMIWSSEGFIYDESDELKLRPERRSIKWNARAYNTAELSCGNYSSISLWGHFYYGAFSC